MSKPDIATQLFIDSLVAEAEEMDRVYQVRLDAALKLSRAEIAALRAQRDDLIAQVKREVDAAAVNRMKENGSTKAMEAIQKQIAESLATFSAALDKATANTDKVLAEILAKPAPAAVVVAPAAPAAPAAAQHIAPPTYDMVVVSRDANNRPQRIRLSPAKAKLNG